MWLVKSEFYDFSCNFELELYVRVSTDFLVIFHTIFTALMLFDTCQNFRKILKCSFINPKQSFTTTGGIKKLKKSSLSISEEYKVHQTNRVFTSPFWPNCTSTETLLRVQKWPVEKHFWETVDLFGTSTHWLNLNFTSTCTSLPIRSPDLTKCRSKEVEVRESKSRGWSRPVEVQKRAKIWKWSKYKKCRTDAYPCRPIINANFSIKKFWDNY